jgi:hypothetical protein
VLDTVGNPSTMELSLSSIVSAPKCRDIICSY